MSQHQGVFAIPESTEGKEALAREAVKVFRTMQPQLTAYARMLTGNPKMRVEVSSSSNGSSNGDRIFYRPPLELGLNKKHNRRLCGKRDENLEMICEACAVREKALVVTYHEIGHICFGSFEAVKESDLAEVTREAVKSTEGKYATKILERIEKAPAMYKNRYMPLANLISEWLPIILNAIEDARVDSRMFKARPGTKVMFDSKVKQVFAEGVEDPTGKKTLWKDQPVNMQAILGVFCIASKYDITDWFDEKVVKDLSDRKLLDLIGKVERLTSVAGSYRLSFPVLARLRELGYCQLPDDPEVEEEPPPFENEEPEDGQEDDSEEDQKDEGAGGSDGDDSEDGESGPSSDSGDGSEQSEATDGEAESSEGQVGSQSGKTSDGEARPGNGSGGSADESDQESSDESADSDESSDSGRGPEDGPGERPEADGSDEGSESDGDSGDSEDGSGGDSSSRGPDERVGDSDDGDSDEHGSDEDSGPGDGNNDEADGGGNDTDEAAGPDAGPGLEGEGQAGDDHSEPLEQDDSDESGTEHDEDASSGDSSPGGEDRSDGADDAGDDASAGGDGNGSDGESEAERDGDSSSEGTGESNDNPADKNDAGKADSREEEPFDLPEDEDGQEAIDTGADLGKGGATVDDASEKELPYGTPAEGKAALLKFGDHEPSDVQFDEQTEEDVTKAFDKAIIQGLYFETSSRGVSTVREHYWDKPVIDKAGNNASTAWSHRSKTVMFSGYSATESGIIGDFEPDEGNLQKSLLKLRRVFADNAVGGRSRHRTSGRVDRASLGKRAGLGDPRLFYSKQKVEKKSYFVVIGIDISGSTAGLNLKLAKKAALAQAMLLHRLGIPFAVYAHTANFADPYSYEAGFAMDIYHIKDPKEPWTEKTMERLTSLGPCEGNLDGHSIEYYRKIAMDQQATDKIVMYYTDGQMPAANYDEELEVLQAQVRHAKRDGVTLMAVGIRTDSPIKHGLDTVTIEEDADNIRVITHLEKRLSNR